MVAAVNASKKLKVYSPISRARKVSSARPMVRAIEEFLIRFIVSLVSGGMMMRNASGSST
jgi:hypothetical protein